MQCILAGIDTNGNDWGVRRGPFRVSDWSSFNHGLWRRLNKARHLKTASGKNILKFGLRPLASSIGHGEHFQVDKLGQVGLIIRKKQPLHK